MRNAWIFVICLLALLFWAPHARAAESYANCTGTISSLPASISSSGTWGLKQSLTTAAATGNAITITADNVTLDCNDFIINGTAGTATNAIGIYSLNHQNVSVRHCNVLGFKDGLVLSVQTAGGGYAAEDNRFDGNTYLGLRVDGDGSVIRRNLVLSTGGTTLTGTVYGIYAADSVDIEDNTVAGVTARTGSNGSAYGIYTTQNGDGSVSRNRVRGMAKDGTGSDFGILNSSSGRIALLENDVFGDGTTGSVGLSCTSSSGRAYDNVLNGFATALKVCGDAGRNDISP
jgi:hypothetical protein